MTIQSLKTARFWTYANKDVVKITIRPGEILEWKFSRNTEEGYQLVLYVWEYNKYKGIIKERIYGTERDCDGKHDWFNEYDCPITELRAFSADGVQMPSWEPVEAKVWDYSAETMGY